MSSLDSCSQHEENITSDKIHELFPTFGKIEQPNQAAEERAAVLRDTIVRGQSDPDISPEILAELQSNLGDALCDAPLVERTEALQEAIACYKAALQIYTLDRYPYRHASIQNNLGNAYADLIAGERSVHQERAIECYEAALYVYTRDIFPVDWAMLQYNDADMLRLALALGRSFLQLEVQHCLKTLSSVIARPLVTWLHGQGVKSLTLIPCGRLAAFPLAAVPLADGSTVGEVLPTSMAPSARSLLYQRRTEPERSGVYALGNPHPTHQELLWGEAEAQTLVYLARRLGMCGEAKVQNQATRASLTQMLSKGYIVDASCHGVFDVDDFLQSSLLLARGKRLALADMLNHKSDLRGLRLLILSACQTAVLDLRGAINEVRSLAVGMVQAGAKAVLASLWRVDDKATYLLMVRFAQEWLPRIEQEPPAAALARAQHWLRTVTNRELQRWRATSLPEITVEERQQAGSVTPLHDPWEEEKGVPVGAAKRVAVRGRGNRYELGEAEALIHTMAAKQDDLDACPYADPIYWAGFQIMGW